MAEDEYRLRRAEAVSFRGLQEGGVLLRIDTGAYFSVNDVGATIWNMLEAGPTLGELVGELARRYTDAGPVLRDDVGDFVRTLRERGLVEVDTTP